MICEEVRRKTAQFDLECIKLQDSCTMWFIARIFKHSTIEKKVFWYKTISREQRCIITLQVTSKSKSFYPRRWILEIDYVYYWMGLGENLAWPWSCRSPSDEIFVICGPGCGISQDPLAIHLVSESFRLLVTSSPGSESFIWPGSNNNGDHQGSIHIQFPDFWMKE